MDLNQLYFEHQLLLMRATCGAQHEKHEVAASLIAGRIGCMQRALGAAAAPVWEGLAVVNSHSLAAPTRHHQGYDR